MLITVTANNLSKSFQIGKGKTAKIIHAVRSISFSAKEGEIFGFLGPDGAGKTTLFRLLATLLLPDSGEATVDGHDIVKDFKAIRQKTGYMPGKFALYQDLTVLENLSIFATIFKTTIEANYHLIKDIYQQIEPFKNRPAGKLSGGMKQKLALCCALVHQPRVLILDEPTTGVDAVSRKEFWDMLHSLKGKGLTILVSTPYMDEAARCDRVALIQEGQLLSIDTPDGIVAAFQKPLWAVRSNKMFQLLHDLRDFPATERCYAFGDRHHLVLKELKEDVKTLQCNVSTQDIVRFLQEKQHEDILVEVGKPTIEDCFIDLIS